MESERAELVLRGPLTPAALGELCRRVHAAAADGAHGPLTCTVEGTADLTVVDALARGRLIAGRHGRTITVRGGSPELWALVRLAGLEAVLRTTAPAPGPACHERDRRGDSPARTGPEGRDPPGC